MQETKTVHEGRNVKHIREILGIKQEALALDLGISQQAISALEQKEALDKDMLEKVATALKVSPEAIKNFDEEKTLNVISNTFHETAFIGSSGTFNVNPIDKWLEALEENKRLYEELLKSEREKVQLLERMLNKG